MQKIRHDLFRQMNLALSHEQNSNAVLALAYWENVLRLLPEHLPIHHHVLEAYRRLVENSTFTPAQQDKFQAKLHTLHTIYSQQSSPKDEETAQQIYQAMCQQCGGNPVLALVYWKNILSTVTSDSLVITLAVQDCCWLADEYLKSKQTERCIQLYKHLLRTFPDFLEGYLNLSLIFYKAGLLSEALAVLQQIPNACKEEFIVSRYIDLFRRLEEISQQFEQVPYAAIEEIVNDLHIENTFYPTLYEHYFTEIVAEIVNREKRFFEKQRKAIEEKALARLNKQLASEGIALGERVTMARQANSENIHTFLYDSHIRIMEVLLDNPNLTADDVLIIAQTTHISEILSHISAHRKWGTLYNIRMAILFNPQTLPKDALALLKLLNINDLAKVFYKRTILTETRLYAKQRIQEIFHALSLSEKIAVIEASSGELFKLLDVIRINVASFLVNLIGKFHDKQDILVNICRWKLTPIDVLAFIARNRQIAADIRIKFALLSNPKTPTETVRSLLHSIPERDIRYLLSNTHLSSTVKQSISSMFPHLFF